jgi:hypothetical protein
MQNVKHNFKENIISAIKAGHHERVIRLLSEEVGKVMAKDKLALIRAVRESGKEIPDNISAESLAKVISSGIQNNNQKFLTKLIETLLLVDQKYSSDISGVGDIVGGVGNIVQGVGMAVAARETARGQIEAAREGTKTAELNTKASRNNMIATMLNAKANSESAKYGLESARLASGSSSKNILTIGIVFGGIMLIGFTGYLFYKKSQSGATSAA